MIDEDDWDIAWMFWVRPVGLGDPSSWQLVFAWLLTLGGAALIVHAVWYSSYGWEQLVSSVPMLLAGLYRVGMTMRSIAIEEDVIALRGWGAVVTRRVRPDDIREVSIGFHGGERCLVLDLGKEQPVRVMADTMTVDWLNARGVRVPEFDTRRAPA